MVLIQSMIGLVLFFVACGAAASIVIFSIDVIRWHDREEKVNVIPSNDTDPIKDIVESEVIDHADESREYNSSTVPDAWL